MRNPPPLRLIPSEADRFITLRPEEPYILNQSFRPFGNEQYNTEKARRPGEYKYTMAMFGMQLLKVGEEYEIGFATDLSIHSWMIGDKDHLIKDDQGDEIKWQSRKCSLEIVHGKAIHFRVEG